MSDMMRRLREQNARLTAEIERLNELLREVGANRYWEGRWRDADAEIARLRVEAATKVNPLQVPRS